MKHRQHHRHAMPKPRLHLSRRAKAVIYSVLGLVWASGVLWLIFHYFFQRAGDFGVEPSPLEHPLIVLHGAGAFAALWLAGWLWSTHIVPWWNGSRRRASGIVLTALGGVLIGSGWLLYYASGEELRRWAGLVHWGVGLAMAVPILVHALRARRYREPSGIAASKT
jgi:hypothetical protein